MPPRLRILDLGLRILLLVLFCAAPLAAQTPPLGPSEPTDDTLTVNVLRNQVAVGEIGQLFVKVRNAEAAMPERIVAEGLDVSFSGQQSHVVISGGRQTVETTYFYRFRGDHPGTYTIPEFEIRLGERIAKTRPLVITIVENSGGDADLDATKPYFGKLELTRDTFYVNELVPFTLTAYVRGRNAINDVVSASLENESFVIKGFREVRTEGSELGNGYYSSAVIPSHLFALRPGTHRLGPAEIAVRVLDSDRGFGLSSIFQRSVTRELVTNTVSVTVKDLPDGAPASFTGGIGDFTLEAAASTTELAIGDPVSIDFTVTGTGNLRTMGAPVFAIPQKGIWRTYEANKELRDEEDSDGFTPGKVHFSQVLIPEARTESIPEFHLTFFNPAEERYVTLKAPPIPLTMREAEPTAASPPIPAAAPSPAAPRLDPASQPEPAFLDVMHIRTGPARWIAAADVGAPHLLFYLTQVIGSIGLSTILVFGLVRGLGERKRRRQAAPVAALSFARALKRVPRAGVSRRDYFHAVSEALAAWRRENHDAPPQVLDVLGRVSERCDAVLYGGQADGETPVSASEVQEFSSLLQRLRQRG